MTIDQTDIDALKKIAGAKGASDDWTVIEPHLIEPRDKFVGKTPLVLFPDSAEMVSKVIAYCHDHDIKIVPQGGNTGLVGGNVPDASNTQIILSMKRMNKVRETDALNHTMTLESGVILADAHTIAKDINCQFPMHIASEGSAMIGGNISSNAGGINVLQYGVMRELVLGLEVVLANGDIWHGLTGLRKDNTGYDLKQLFIGAEGTLGVITAATLKLYPEHVQKNTAFVAVEDPDAAIKLLGLAREISGDSLIAFEILPRVGLDITIEHMPSCRDPLESKYDWYILMECATSMAADLLDLEIVMERILERSMEMGHVIDGVVPKNDREMKELWNLREHMSEGQKFEGGSIKHDIAVPVSKIPIFLERATEAVTNYLPGIRPVPFGHIGDGNIHFNLSQPVGMDKSEYLAKWSEINRLVHDIVVELGGSISAEHGIGSLKLEELEYYKSDTELNIMRDIKRVLDSKNIMNPGRVIR
tara:strand:- start:115425 stop:116849 length:1425 start_codon:yes stop_codon:yes gene_type:complete